MKKRRPIDRPGAPGGADAVAGNDVCIPERGIAVPRTEFAFEFIRSSGPGGQNVNKVATKARLRWKVTESGSLPEDVRQRFLSRYRRRITSEGDFLLTSQRYRDQAKNAEDCVEKLRELLAAVAPRPVPRKKTKPSRGSRERRLASKRERSQRKEQRRPPRLD